MSLALDFFKMRAYRLVLFGFEILRWEVADLVLVEEDEEEEFELPSLQDPMPFEPLRLADEAEHPIFRGSSYDPDEG